MSKITIKEHKAANGGDYDTYILSNGEKYYLWMKASFKGGELALVHIMAEDDTEIGIVTLSKDISNLTMSLNGQKIITQITINQFLRPNKKYFFDKIVKEFLMKSSNNEVDHGKNKKDECPCCGELWLFNNSKCNICSYDEKISPESYRK